jgi:hypothetical protein
MRDEAAVRTEDVARWRLVWTGDTFEKRRMTAAELRAWGGAVVSLGTWARSGRAAIELAPVRDEALSA